MTPNRLIHRLILLASIAGWCGCGAYRDGVLHPRDYGTIGTTPHCVSGRLINDPMFYGHKPTRWREWPADPMTWRYSTLDCYPPTGAEVDVYAEPVAPPQGETPSEELPVAPDPSDAPDPFPDDTSQTRIDRLPSPSSEIQLAAFHSDSVNDPANPSEE